jgi:transposase
MILAVPIDGDGRPVCSEMWPGNTADVTALVPVIDRLRERFAIGRICIVADHGMISAETIAALETRGLLYILGVRERTDTPPRRGLSRHFNRLQEALSKMGQTAR